jgi:uncharacterized protein YraI
MLSGITGVMDGGSASLDSAFVLAELVNQSIMSYQPKVVRFLHIPYSQRFHTRYNRRWRSLGLAALLCLLVFVLAACGPQRRPDESDLTADTIRIAQEYEQSGDLNRARTELQTLDAANPTQWLIYLAETRVHDAPGAAETNSLVWLAMALGLQSRPLVDYAAQNNLLVNAPPPTLEVVAQAGSAVMALAPVTSTAAAPPPAVDPAGSTLVTSGVGVTVSQGVSETAPAAPGAALPTPTTISKPMAQASNGMNLRGGPGIAYPVVGALNAGEQVEIIGKNPQADWWQVLLPSGLQGWLYSPLVQTLGDTAAIAVAANIPEPPPTPVPAPTSAPAPAADQPPAEMPPAEAPPAETPQPEQPAAPPSDKPYFTLVDRRLWSKAENGDCRGQHLLRIHVLDANGARLNGVALQGIYTGEIIVTGAQGKGDGIIEYDLYGPGEGFRVIRDADGRDASSDPAEGFTTRSVDIPQDLLIQTGYCSDDETCRIFYNSYGCHGHHSWEATFKRNY